MEVLQILGYDMLMSENDIVGISNCLTIVNTSYKNRFQKVGVSLTELINENSFLLPRNL